MNNPWEEISLDDYENHMRLDTVKQLQAMSEIMKEQFAAYPVESAMILGVAGGNGLEHIRTDKYRRVYGVDINSAYLNAVQERYPQLADVLQCLHLDLINETEQLPQAQLVIANLLIEYIGYPAFQKAVLQIDPEYVSCLIQINTDAEQWVSESPYLHAFDRLDEVHHQMEAAELSAAMQEIGCAEILRASVTLPNGKALVRIDYRKTGFPAQQAPYY